MLVAFHARYIKPEAISGRNELILQISFSAMNLHCPYICIPGSATKWGVQALKPIFSAWLQCDKYPQKTCLLGSGH